MNKYIAICVATTIIAAACNNKPATPPQQATTAAPAPQEVITLSEVQYKNAGISVGLPEEREMHINLKVTGAIEVPPQNVVSVSMPMGGYLKKAILLPGEHVKRGDVLATLEDQQYIQLQQDYLTAKSKLGYYEAENVRQKELNETHAASDKVYQQARADYDGQRILMRSLAEKLRLIGIDPAALTEANISRMVSLRAPADGYVTKVNVNAGKYVAPADVLFELTNPADMHLTLTVLEQDAGKLQPGQMVQCYANSRPDVRYTAKVHLVNPSIGTERSTEVHCDFEGSTKGLLPGMYVNAEIELEHARQQCLPADAVVKWEGASYVFAEEGPRSYRMIKVTTGNTDAGYTAITGTLPTGKIVVANAYALLMKLKNSAEE